MGTLYKTVVCKRSSFPNFYILFFNSVPIILESGCRYVKTFVETFLTV